MINCERCGTQNLEGSRYCDECGAAMWLTGTSSDLTSRAHGNGNERNGGRDASATVVQSARPDNKSTVSQRATSAPLVAPEKKVHALLVIERGSSAGKQFSLSDEE